MHNQNDDITSFVTVCFRHKPMLFLQVIVSATMNLDIYLESFTDVLNHTSITEIPNGSNNIVPALFHLCVQPLQKYTQGNRCPYGEVTIAPNPTTSFGHNNMIRFRDFATIVSLNSSV